MLARLKPAEITLDEHVAPIRLPRVSPATPPLLSLESAAVGYDPQRPVLTRISLRVDPDERIALLGKNGNGKSTFAKLLAGKLQPFSGTVARAPGAVAGYFAQHQLEELDGRLTPLDTLGHMRPRLSERELRTQLAGFGLAGDKALTKVGELSGGERARLMLALATLDAPNLLILDEPTNHLDIDAREQLLAALNDYAGAVVLVSHDRRLIETTVDRLLLVGNGTVSAFEGDLEDYRRQVLAPETELREARKPESRRDQRRDGAARRTQLKPLREKATAAEAEIAQLTQNIADLDAALSASDAFARDPAKAAETARRRAAAERALSDAEARWLDATQAYEDALAEDQGTVR
jgi:ATP-binding cassette subfamily F protein 3